MLDPELGRMLQRTGDGVFVTGAAGCVLAWNRAAERIVGFTAREVVSKACCEIFLAAAPSEEVTP
jgi:PAS domain S-box-containing protein